MISGSSATSGYNASATSGYNASADADGDLFAFEPKFSDAFSQEVWKGPQLQPAYDQLQLPSFMQTYPGGKYQQYDLFGRKSSVQAIVAEPRAEARYKRKAFSMNVNAQSYTPMMAGSGSEEGLSLPTDNLPMSATFKKEGKDDEAAMLRAELALKELLVKSLGERLRRAKEGKDGDKRADGALLMPLLYRQLFQDMTRTLNERSRECEETKARLEALVVALVMNKDAGVAAHGSCDPQETAHRITTKMAVLQAENETLLRMASFSNKQSLLIENGLLRSENQALKAKLSEAK